ncbi:hypothetical protein M409DRAFT_22475 [Zasmidium cellare ATCC 36951]|uniref:Cupin type-2 domain-containing protein n=1 Tax=Zasmidium cellare ATCC 36951 TaxID=1080233 RepID=A0A6A6CIE4_ZASCE|nr:uncharacterized protein M409DRAFT_22475 [Zasmidium cellare ATCC 36951]KAF2167037.1 hypothetical protein M409DRAFT_22475 [Zasmidium cellare ATCC 36951]
MSAATTDPSKQGVVRTILNRLPIPALPGWESRTVLLDYPPSTTAPPHTHPVSGVNYIIHGHVISQWENGEEEVYGPGEVFLDHAEKVHTVVRNPSETERLLVVVNYVIPVGVANVNFPE